MFIGSSLVVIGQVGAKFAKTLRLLVYFNGASFLPNTCKIYTSRFEVFIHFQLFFSDLPIFSPRIRIGGEQNWEEFLFSITRLKYSNVCESSPSVDTVRPAVKDLPKKVIKHFSLRLGYI